MNLVEVLERCGQICQDCLRIAEVLPTDVVVTKLSAMPLLCGLHTSVFTGMSPSDPAMCLVSCAM
jgi:hypothetical protein